MNHISSFPFRFYFQGKDEATTKGPIIIEDDVWIGMDSILLSGIRIGQGSVIASGSVVTKSFPPYSIIGGNPARILKQRFDNSKIKDLLKLDFNNINRNFITEHIEDFYNKENFDSIVKKLSKID